MKIINSDNEELQTIQQVFRNSVYY